MEARVDKELSWRHGPRGYLELPEIFGVSLWTILWVVLIAAVAIVLERLVTRYLRKFGQRAHMEPHVTNSLVLTFRVLILIGALASVVRVGGLPADWFVAFSALGGAAVGFASQTTIGNFVAGLYLFAARPFKVGDLVRIGTVEGIVEEITINYTKILTIGDNIASLINLQILQRDITNFSFRRDERDGLHCYTFEVGFDHSVSTDSIEKIFDNVFKQCAGMLTREPNYMLARSGAFERVYTVYLYVKDPRDTFTLRSKIAESVFRLWDVEREKAQITSA